MPAIKKIPAPVRFLSMEPLLESVKVDLEGSDWVIVGGESGRAHRTMQKRWARELRDQCKSAGVPFFFKQWGGEYAKNNGHMLERKEYREFPTPKDRLSAVLKQA